MKRTFEQHAIGFVLVDPTNEKKPFIALDSASGGYPFNVQFINHAKVFHTEGEAVAYRGKDNYLVAKYQRVESVEII